MKTEVELKAQAMSREQQQEEYRNYLEYNEEGSLPENLVLVYHDYACGNYEGSSYGFGYDTETGLWFEVSGGHCSCYGLEGQWDPEFSTFDELMFAIKKRLDAAQTSKWSQGENDSTALADFLGYVYEGEEQ